MDEQQPQPNEMSKPTAWVVLIVIIIILGVGAYFLLFQDEETNTNNANSTVNTNTETNTNTATNTNRITTHDELFYSNEEFGFQLEFPEEWKGYTTEIWRGYFYDVDNKTDHTFIEFRHPQTESSDGQSGAIGFLIAVTEDSQVELFRYFNLLDTSDKGTRYSYRTGTGAAPGDLSQYSAQIPSIISTFKVI